MRVPKRTSFDVVPFKTPLREAQNASVPGAFGERVGESLTNLASQTMALGAFIKEQEDKKLRFAALKSFANFEVQQKLRLNEATRTATPGDPNFYEGQFAAYKEQEKAFLANLPPELQEEFSVRTAELGGNLGLAAAKYQYEANDTYFKQGIQDVTDQARTQVSQDGSRENLEKQRGLVDEAISAAGLSEAEQQAVRRNAYSALEGAAYRAAQIERLRNEQEGTGTDVEQATNLLVSLGGVAPEAAADEALKAAGEAQALVGGLDAWAALPTRVRSALVMAQATTGISNAAQAALANGDLDALATALRSSGNEAAGDLILNPESGIDNDPAYANVPYEDRLTLLADAKRQVAAEATDLAQAKKAQNEVIVNDLLTGIHDGAYGQTEIEQARESGVLTDYDDILRAEKALKDRDSAQQLKALGIQMMNGGVVFAPGNADHMKALNAVVGTDGLAAIEKKDGAYAANTLIPLVRNAGAVPSDVVDLLRGMIRKDSQTAYWALDLMSQIKRTDAKAFNSFPEDDQKTLDFWEARRDYIPEDEMIKAINGPLDNGERSARAELRKQGSQLFTAEDGPLKDFDPLTLFVGAPNTARIGFGGTVIPSTMGQPTVGGMPWVGPQLNADFQTLFLDAYELSGNEQYATEAAKTQLQRVWGVTNVGDDNKLMRYPPEKMYPPVRESYDWLEQQLRRDGILAENETFQLMSDDQTESELTSGAPSYLLVKTIDGRQEIPMDANGLPIRVNFDYGVEEQLDEQKWREEQRVLKDAADAEKLLGAAVQHEFSTGTPMPGELLEPDQAGGILEHLMNDDPAALTEAERRVRELMIGNGSGQGGIATGQYRLP